MELINQINTHFNIPPNQNITENCLKEVSERLNITYEDVLNVFKRYFGRLLISRYNLDTISFDLIENYIFERLQPTEILSVCSVNQKYYSWCRNNDSYWQKYLKKHYNLTQKPTKYAKWFDLAKQIIQSSSSILEIDTENRVVDYLGEYVQYNDSLRIDSNFGVELFLYDSSLGEDSYVPIDNVVLLKRAGFIYGKELYLFGSDLNDKPVFYHLGTKYNIQTRLLPLPPIFGGAGPILQILNYSYLDCYVLTENSLYHVDHKAKINKIKIPTKFKHISAEMMSPRKHIACIDLNGEVWVRGKFKLGQYMSKGKVFTKITTQVPTVKSVLQYGINDDELRLTLLDINGRLWSIGSDATAFLTEEGSHYRAKLTQINNYRDVESRNIITDIKFKSICSEPASFHHSVLAITENNKIYTIQTIEGDFKDMKVQIPLNFVQPELENTLRRKNNYVRSFWL